MNTGQQEKPVYVTRGFLEKFSRVFKKPDDVSLSEITHVLVFQPHLVVHLLRMANIRYEKGESLAVPKSIPNILAILGVDAIVNECLLVSEVPIETNEKLRSQSIEAYALAVVFSEIAERTLGRYCTDDFFLAALMSPIVAEDPSVLDGCHEDIPRHFNGTLPPGHPTIPDAIELVEYFKMKRPTGYADILGKWTIARERARQGIDVI